MWNCTFTIKETVRVLQTKIRFGFLRNTENVSSYGKATQPADKTVPEFASIKLDVEQGERYISRVRSNDAQAIQDVFKQINERVNEELTLHPEYADNVALQKANIPYIGELFLGHVRYGTFGEKQY